ncbi:hypothetical protein M1D93_19635 [Arthrobacter sp. Z1-9]
MNAQISLVRILDQGYIGRQRLGTVLNATSGQAVHPLMAQVVGGRDG